MTVAFQGSHEGDRTTHRGTGGGMRGGQCLDEQLSRRVVAPNQHLGDDVPYRWRLHSTQFHVRVPGHDSRLGRTADRQTPVLQHVVEDRRAVGCRIRRRRAESVRGVGGVPLGETGVHREGAERPGLILGSGSEALRPGIDPAQAVETALVADDRTGYQCDPGRRNVSGQTVNVGIGERIFKPFGVVGGHQERVTASN